MRHFQRFAFTLPWLMLCLALFACLPCQATTYYVSASGSDTNNGSQAAPFRQIRAALTRVAAGDTVLVSDGSYLGFDVNGLHGSSGQPITIQATGTNANITVTTDRSDNRDTIFITFSSYIVLDGLRAFNANRAAIRIDSSPNITVKNGVYGNNATWGIFTDFSDNTLLQNNECYASQTQHGIYISNSSQNPIIRGNRLHDNQDAGLHMNGDLSQGGNGLITNALVENNLIYNNGVGGGAGINMDGVQDSTVRNNLLYNNHATGIACFQIDGAAGPKGNQILHNTLDMASDGRWALLIKDTSGQNTVRNNILYNRNTARGGLLFGSSADVGNVNSDYNILDWVTTDDGDTRISLSQWQAQGHEIYSLSTTPASLFVNPAGGDYHLLSSAPAIDRGLTLGSVTTDLEGNARPAGLASDVGCYEYAARVPYDFNSDGHSDLVWQNQATGDATYWQLTNGVWTGAWGYLAQNIGTTWKIVAAPDLDGNGSVSLVWQNQTTGDVTYWQMSGPQWTGNWAYLAQRVSTDWKIVGSGDLTGDGTADLVWLNQTTGDVSYWEIKNAAWTGNWAYIGRNIPTAWKIEGVLDVTGDTQPDLVWRNLTTGDVTYWQMNRTQWTGNSGYLAHNVPTVWQIVGVH